MTVGDIPSGMVLCRGAGWNQLEDDWRLFLGSSKGGGFMAEKEGRALGTVAFLRYGSFAWIAMMLVDPAERRAGIGACLMDAVMKELSGVPCVGLDAT